MAAENRELANEASAAPSREPRVGDGNPQAAVSAGATAPHSAGRPATARNRRPMGIAGIAILAVGLLLYWGFPELLRILNTVSTDDAYVNGHVTFVAARVPGQVTTVWVDDNDRVQKGSILVRVEK